MINQLKSIPVIMQGILLVFLTILAIRIFYPVANVILDLFEPGMMKIVANLVYWLVILFVTWFLIWVKIFKVTTVEETKEKIKEVVQDS